MKETEDGSRLGGHAAGLFIIAIGAFAALEAMSYTIGSASHMGPGYFPLALGLMLIVVGTLVILFERMPPSKDDGFEFAIIRPILAILAAMLAFALLVERFGLVPAVFAASLISSVADRDFHWGRSVIIASVLAIGATLVFKFGLNIYVDIIKW